MITDVLESGGILLYPTDTLYGLGVDALNVDALRRLKKLKGRDEKKPISVIVLDIEMAEKYAEVTPLARILTARLLPGKLTLILKAKNNVPEELTVGTGTVGIRIPNHILCLNLVRDFGRPFTATSANVAGMESKRSVPEILGQFGDRVDMIDHIIDSGELVESKPSTVLDARNEKPLLLREGAVSKEEIFSIL